MYWFPLRFGNNDLEARYEVYLRQRRAQPERMVMLLVTVVDWVFVYTVIKTKGLWSLGALFQFFLLALPCSACTFYMWKDWSPPHQETDMKKWVRALFSWCYLPICLFVFLFRTATAEQHPFEFLRSDNVFIFFLLNFLVMPVGALLAPGVFGHLLTVYYVPEKFSTQWKHIIASSILCVLAHTGQTGALLMADKDARNWCRQVAFSLDMISSHFLTQISGLRLQYNYPILYPCQLWWLLVAIFFQGFLSLSLIWFREFKDRQKFEAEHGPQRKVPDEQDDLQRGNVPHGMPNYAFTGLWPWVLFAAFLFAAMCTTWKACVYVLSFLTKNGWDGCLLKNENWGKVGDQFANWRNEGVT